MRHIMQSMKGLSGTWRGPRIVASGRNCDWLSPYPFVDTYFRTTYAAANDRNNLYATIATREREDKAENTDADMKL